MFRSLFILFIIVGFLSGCSIEKRLYSRGYHVEWKKSLKSSGENQAEANVVLPEVKEQSQKAGYSEALELPALDEVDNEKKTTTEESTLINESKLVLPVKDTVYIYDDQVEIEPFGLAASLSLVGSFLITRIPIPQVWLIALALFAAAFILSIISMIHFATNKGYYKTNVLGVLTFILCLVVILIFALIIIAFAF